MTAIDTKRRALIEELWRKHHRTTAELVLSADEWAFFEALVEAGYEECLLNFARRVAHPGLPDG